jgi:poly-gamma-glutamate capsule biosynthesis protein CapA/YwtB (metallophosphatase superfamily)
MSAALLVAAAVLSATLGGCGTAPAPTWSASSATSTPTGAPGAAGSATASAGPSATPSRASRDITLAVAGDVHFTGRTAPLLNHPETAFGSIAGVLRGTDLTVLNLETAITTRGTEQPKEYHFRAPATAFDALRAAGVDAVSFANNHVLDYGQVGLADTLAAAQAARFPYFGIGVDADAAWAPLVLTVASTRIAFVGVSQVHALASSWVATGDRPGEANAINTTRTLAAVRAARAQADVVIVFMHWGTEGDGCPNAEQKSLAKKVADAGADIILGAHAHVLQGSGWLGRTYVAYGMGNFLWYGTSRDTKTGVLKLTLHPDAPLSAQFLPAVVSSTGQPVLLTGSVKSRAEKNFANLRSCTGLAAAPAPAG